MNIPTFYKIDLERYKAISPGHQHSNAFRVFAESNKHRLSDWITLGYVSLQSPFGQGTFCGFPRAVLLPALPSDVIANLLCPHPQGADFLPFLPVNIEALSEAKKVVWRNGLNNQIEAVVKGMPSIYQECWKMLKDAGVQTKLESAKRLEVHIPRI